MSFAPTNANIQAAVNGWCANPQVPEAYGGGVPIGNWDVSAITDMNNLFRDKGTFNEDISGWVVSNVTNMNSMFYGCTQFTNAGVPLTWDVSKVTDMNKMFYQAWSSNVDVSSWDVSSVTNMDQMFRRSSFNNGEAPGESNKPLEWNVSSVTTISGMFKETHHFNQEITNWDVSNVTHMIGTFQKMNFNQDITSWNVSSVKQMHHMFDENRQFSYDIRRWPVVSVHPLKFHHMFANADAMNAAPYNAPVTPSPDTEWFNSYEYVFVPTTKAQLQTALSELIANTSPNIYNDVAIGEWDVTAITDMSSLFFTVTGKETFNDDISGWDTSNVTNMGFMFNGCSAFNNGGQTLAWNTAKVTNMGYMFNGCSAFNNGGQTLAWNTAKVTTMEYMFWNCSAFNQIPDFSDTSKVTNMSQMFKGCTVFNKSINFNTSSVTNMEKMFFQCSSFDSSLTFIDTSSVTNMKDMFGYASVFNQEIRSWVVTSVEEGKFDSMFTGATAMNGAPYNAPETPPAAWFTMPTKPTITLHGFNPFYIERTDPTDTSVEAVAARALINTQIATITATPAQSDSATATANGQYEDVTVTGITGPDGATSIDASVEGLYYITYSATNDIGTTTKRRAVNVHIPQVGIPICFPKDTPVLTNLGPVAIEKLNPDQHTICGKEIVAITQTQPLQKHIVCFEENSLGNNIPSQKTLCSKEHKISYQGEMTKARDLVDLCENVTFIPYNGETLYNVLLKQHDTMMINNMVCETLHPENIAAKISTMKDCQKKGKIICELNKIIKENNILEYQKLYASL